MFYNAVLMNVLIMAYYTLGLQSDDNPHGRRMSATGTTVAKDTSTYPLLMQSDADTALYWLNIAQIVISAMTVIIFLVVRVPVTFLGHLESGAVVVEAFLKTLGDPLPLWYLIYFGIAILGFIENRLLLSLLLLDFAILDPTSRDLLQAIWNPARQLMATLVIICIVLNVFAGAVFYWYRDDVINLDIFSMWESFKLGVSYGIRGEYGVSHEMANTLGSRMILDVTFYFIVSLSRIFSTNCFSKL